MKKTHRFLISQKPFEHKVEINDVETVHLISNVLKLRIGEECIVFSDGGDDYVCEISEIAKKAVLLNIKHENKKLSIPKNLTSCVSITKKDSFELIVQKLTELGVQNIIPIVSDRTIKQSLRIDRLQKISDEALEQSGGSSRVQINLPMSLEEALKINQSKEQCYFDISGNSNLKTETKDIVFYIGPEGGWSDSDKELFNKYSVKSYKLTQTTLRSETAAIIATYALLSK